MPEPPNLRLHDYLVEELSHVPHLNVTAHRFWSA